MNSLPLSLFAAATFALCLGSCGNEVPKGANPQGTGTFLEKTRTTKEIALELLFQEPSREVVHENANYPVSVGHIRPLASEVTTLRELPSLLMVPPSEVKITIPEHGISRSVDLHANFGVDAKSCADNPVGQTHYIAFEVLINGEQVSRGGIRVHGPNVLHQNWIDIVDKDGSLFQLVTGDTLVLRTSVTSKPEVDWQAAPFALPKVGFGRLQLRGQVEAPIEIASEGHPNILFVLMDTLRADRTSLGGNPVLTTPNLDRLAAGGTSYSQARATSSWTWPSTASVLTGRLPAGHGVQDMGSSYLNGEVDTLAEIMQRRGLATGGFVGNRLVSSNFNFDQGFQEFFDPNKNEFLGADVVLPQATR